jgi:7-cyano-7-deazaguanine synthase
VSAKRAMVLLSGGLDSSMVLVQALRDGCEVVALTVFYGQPAKEQEESAAGAVAARFGVERIRVYTCDTLPRPTQLGTASAEDRGIISSAFVPGRNAVMLTIAAAHAAVRWPDGGPFELWIGACHDDIGGFPDCRQPFLAAASTMLTRALDREVSIVAPMLAHTKASMLLACRYDATLLEVARMSFSCYRGTRCGECKPCVLRAEAFRKVGLEDA